MNTLPTDIATEAYEYALQAAGWLFGTFPSLAKEGYEREDLAGDWFDKKSKYLIDFKATSEGTPFSTSLKYYVFLGVKRFALTKLYKNPNKGVYHVSLDAVNEQGSRYIDLLADPKAVCNPCISDEVLKEASETLVGCVKGDRADVVTADGQVIPKTLRSVIELKVEGWSGAEIADLFGLSRQFISRVLQRSAVQFATSFQV